MNEDYNNYYDWSTYQINYQLIKQRLQQLKSQNYSTQLISTVEKLLQKDEFYRLNITQLLEIIKSNIHRFKPIDLTSKRSKSFKQNNSLISDRTSPGSDKNGNRYGSTRTYQGPNPTNNINVPPLSYNQPGKENRRGEFDTMSERVQNSKI